MDSSTTADRQDKDKIRSIHMLSLLRSCNPVGRSLLGGSGNMVPLGFENRSEPSALEQAITKPIRIAQVLLIEAAAHMTPGEDHIQNPFTRITGNFLRLIGRKLSPSVLITQYARKDFFLNSVSIQCMDISYNAFT